MKAAVIGVSLMALMVPQAYAEQGTKPTKPMAGPAEPMIAQASPSSTQEQRKFQVFFDWDKATLTPQAKDIIAKAADEFKRSGSARLVATGHTDTSGSASYNMGLSIRRAEAVKAELVRLGVPAGVITTIGRGQQDLLVPTADGVREAQNRRVSIEYQVPVAAKPAPTPPPPVAAAPPPPAPPPPLKWSATVGPWVGWNLRERDPGDPSKKSTLVGPEVRVGYNITPEWMLYLDGVAFNTIKTSEDDGWGGRGAFGVSHVWDLGSFHPFIGPKVGYYVGKGVQDGVFAGPEVGVNVDIAENMYLYARAAYDSVFRNDFGQGVVNGGLGVGLRF
jgi:outer membrane protein OmpA-like peptidoglycan-associated protein